MFTRFIPIYPAEVFAINSASISCFNVLVFMAFVFSLKLACFSARVAYAVFHLFTFS
jgi:hypothetical protein